jgi:hypothetical protein
VTATLGVLDSLNHKLVPIVITVAATDDIGIKPRPRIIAVTCNESVNAPGSGHADPDWIITEDSAVSVRAARAGTVPKGAKYQ